MKANGSTKAISYRLFWNSTTMRWTLAKDVTEANRCETTVIAEYGDTSSCRRWLAPKEWAAELADVDEDDFRGVVDEYHGHPMTWHVTALAVA